MSLAPSAIRRVAAADWYGKAAGRTVRSDSNADAVRMRVVGCEGVLESWMEVMACEVDVRARACAISCLSFA